MWIFRNIKSYYFLCPKWGNCNQSCDDFIETELSLPSTWHRGRLKDGHFSSTEQNHSHPDWSEQEGKSIWFLQRSISSTLINSKSVWTNKRDSQYLDSKAISPSDWFLSVIFGNCKRSYPYCSLALGHYPLDRQFKLRSSYVFVEKIMCTHVINTD